jgi:putative FmdB family regulatory protein
MPTYEYKCPNGHLFEKTFPRITSKRHAKCPVCGFYATDYKRPAGTTEKADNTAEKAEKTAKPDSKPSSKKDSSSDK